MREKEKREVGERSTKVSLLTRVVKTVEQFSLPSLMQSVIRRIMVCPDY